MKVKTSERVGVGAVVVCVCVTGRGAGGVGQSQIGIKRHDGGGGRAVNVRSTDGYQQKALRRP